MRGSMIMVGLAAGMLGTAALAETGTGFYLNDQGWALTNRHVVDDCAAVQVGGAAAISVITDPVADLALVHAPNPAVTHKLAVRQRPPMIGEPVAVAGFPLPTLLDAVMRTTMGEVNAQVGPQGDARYIQMSAPIQPGNSGGPLLDENGLVIGVVAATLSAAAFDQAQNVNFAVSSEQLFRFLDAADVAYTASPVIPGAVIQLGGNAPTIQSRAAEASAAIVQIVCLN